MLSSEFNNLVKSILRRIAQAYPQDTSNAKLAQPFHQLPDMMLQVPEIVKMQFEHIQWDPRETGLTVKIKLQDSFFSAVFSTSER